MINEDDIDRAFGQLPPQLRDAVQSAKNDPGQRNVFDCIRQAEIDAPDDEARARIKRVVAAKLKARR